MEFVAALQASRCRGPHASPRDDVGWAVLLMHGLARFEDVCACLYGLFRGFILGLALGIMHSTIHYTAGGAVLL